MPNAVTSVAAKDALFEEWPRRDRDLIVVREGMTLPRICPICAKPTTEPPLTLSLVRDNGAGFVGSLVADAIDGVKGSNYTGPVRASFHFCPWHRNFRRNLIYLMCSLIGVGGAVVGVFLLLPRQMTFRYEGLLFFPVAMAMIGMFGLGSFLRSRNPWFKPKHFNDRTVWLKGAGTLYLLRIDEVSAARSAAAGSSVAG